MFLYLYALTLQESGNFFILKYLPLQYLHTYILYSQLKDLPCFQILFSTYSENSV